MKKWAIYIKEREGSELYEDEYGFITYKINGNIFYVDDLLVLPEYRKQGIGKKYIKKIDDMAREYNCTIIYCTTCPSAKNWKQSERYILNNGYTKINTLGDLIYYKKEICYG